MTSGLQHAGGNDNVPLGLDLRIKHDDNTVFQKTRANETQWTPPMTDRTKVVAESLTHERHVSNPDGEARTFVRVKRKVTEDPAVQLILSYKRQRLEVSVEDDEKGFETVNSILNFAGTHHPSESVGSFVKNLVTGSELQNQAGGVASFAGSARRKEAQREAKKQSSKSRYKVVSAKRGLEDPSVCQVESDEVEKSYIFDLFDLVEPDGHKPEENTQKVQDDVITCNGEPMIEVKASEGAQSGKAVTDKPDYVYDVYALKSPLRHVEDLHVDVEHLWEPELVPEQEDAGEEGPGDEADTDSNDENNPNNSYPEEDSDFSDDMEKEEKESYNAYEQDYLYDWPDDDEQVFVEGEIEEAGSYAMKELAKHVKEVQEEMRGNVKADKFSSSESDGDESDDENDDL